MKGLFIKEWEYMKNQRSAFIMLALIIGVQMAVGNIMFGIAFLIFLVPSMIVNGISVDDTNNSYPFLLSLPIDRKTYVAEKYLAMLLLSVLGLIVSAAAALAVGSSLLESAAEALAYCTSITIVAVMFQALWMPVQLKFDAAKAQTMRFISVAVVVALGFGGVYLLKKAGINVEGALESVSRMTVLQALAIAGAAAAALTFISYKVSVRIMEKKEF